MRRLALGAWLVLTAVAARAGTKEAVEAYEQGVSAMQAGRAAEAVTLMESALRAQPKEGAFRAGVKTVEYAPSRWLAEAHLALGHCDDARRWAATARSVKMGASERAGLDALAQRLAACGASAASAPVPPSAPAPPAAGATAAVAGATAAIPGRAPCPELQQARDALRSGDPATARRLARRCAEADSADPGARAVLDDVAAMLQGKITRALREEGAGNVAAAAALAREVLAVDPDDEDAKALASRAAAAPRTAGGATPPPGPSGATGVVAASAPAPASAPAAAAIPAGVAAYFRGDIDASIGALEAGAATPEELTVYACALATRSLLQADAAAAGADLSKAREAWRQVLARKPAATLDPRWISPRVRRALGG